jgi:hypothetical protein
MRACSMQICAASAAALWRRTTTRNIDYKMYDEGATSKEASL